MVGKTSFRAADFTAMFSAMADTMQKNRDELCVLDGIIGDADHGISMALGFETVCKDLAERNPAPDCPTDVFNFAARSFLNAVGASTGPLYATAFMRAAAVVKGKDEADEADIVTIIAAIARGISDRGKAKVGDKTMLDAWDAAASATQTAWADHNDLHQALHAGAIAAENGAESTRNMIARLGRASRLGERSVGHIDPGAASAAILMRSLACSLSKA
jgi:dihydroxyacetone kinase-like protein